MKATFLKAKKKYFTPRSIISYVVMSLVKLYIYTYEFALKVWGVTHAPLYGLASVVEACEMINWVSPNFALSV